MGVALPWASLLPFSSRSSSPILFSCLTLRASAPQDIQSIFIFPKISVCSIWTCKSQTHLVILTICSSTSCPRAQSCSTLLSTHFLRIRIRIRVALPQDFLLTFARDRDKEPSKQKAPGRSLRSLGTTLPGRSRMVRAGGLIAEWEVG